MERRDFLKTAAMATGGAALPGYLNQAKAAGQNGASGDRPNIIWLYADDHAVQALSAYGGRLAELAPTPNLDRLASQGMLFQESCVANSICAPGRACVLTGKHSHKNGIKTNRHSGFKFNQPTFPAMLRENGYTTALFGKWHLKSLPQGFDDYAVLPGQGRYYNPVFRTKTENGAKRSVVNGHTTRVIMDKTLEYLQGQQDADKPFLMMCQFKAPHRTWIPALHLLDLYEDTVFPEPATLYDDYRGRGKAVTQQEMEILTHMGLEHDLKRNPEKYRRAMRVMNDKQKKAFIDHYKKRWTEYDELNLAEADDDTLLRWKYQKYLEDYLACIRGIDEQVGRLLDYLDKTGMSRNTVVCYSSDQGFYLGEHGWFDKRWMYEESFKTPLIVRWPGVTPAGSEASDIVQSIDMAPTFLDIAGVYIPDSMQGVSITPLLQGRSPKNWRDSVYYHYYESKGPHKVAKHEGVYNGRYKLMHFYEAGYWEFYDLQRDPHEIRSAYDDPQYASEVKMMKKELQALKKKYDAPPVPAASKDKGTQKDQGGSKKATSSNKTEESKK